MNTATENKTHPIVAASVIMTMALYDGFVGALKTVRWLWRWFLHLTWYGQGPGKAQLVGIVDQLPTDGELIGRMLLGAHVDIDSAPSVIAGVQQMPEKVLTVNTIFRVSNPIFAQKERLTHSEAEELVAAVRRECPMPTPGETLVWKGMTYRYVQVPSLNLRRRPDDVYLYSERRWEANATAA